MPKSMYQILGSLRCRNVMEKPKKRNTTRMKEREREIIAVAGVCMATWRRTQAPSGGRSKNSTWHLSVTTIFISSLPLIVSALRALGFIKHALHKNLSPQDIFIFTPHLPSFLCHVRLFSTSTTCSLPETRFLSTMH